MTDKPTPTDAATPERLTCSDHGAVGNSGFDYKTAADLLSRKTVSGEALRKFVAASSGAHDARAALHAKMLSLQGELASREAEIALLKRSLLDAEADAAAPQPSPTAQAAESVPAIQGEMNVQLDIDSNHSAPGQQRDVARSVALGQPMGNGQDQAAGRPSAQEDKLLTVAERNIRSFLRSATFKSESDREAALNCVDVLWAAARDPADSVQEDAALWHWLAEYLVGTRTDLDDEIVACETVNDLRKLVEAAIKQGANHDR